MPSQPFLSWGVGSARLFDGAGVAAAAACRGVGGVGGSGIGVLALFGWRGSVCTHCRVFEAAENVL